MRKQLLFAIAVICCVMNQPAQAEVYSGNCGAVGDGSHLQWMVDTGKGLLKITGSGEMAVHDYGQYPWSQYSGDIITITFPAGLTAIGRYAFASCTQLQEAIFESGITAFPDGLFYKCHSLKTLNIPQTVTSIGGYAFSGCKNMYTLNLPAGLNYIGEDAFAGAGLDSIIIPSGVTIIPKSLFEDCYGLTSVTMGDAVTSIREDAFSGCYHLEQIRLPQALDSIGKGAFFDCLSLTSITLPKNVIHIGRRAFSSCPALTEILVDSDSRSYSSQDGILFNKNKSELVLCPEGIVADQYVIPSSVVYINKEAFEECKGITSVVIPSTVTGIGDMAFYGVPNIIYSGSLDGAPWDAASMNGYVDGWLVFDDEQKTQLAACSKAATGVVNLPTTVMSVKYNAFKNCKSITSLVVPNTIADLSSSAFDDILNVIYSDTAKAAPWGAKCLNGYIDGQFAYADETKTKLLGCLGSATGIVSIPNSVTEIGEHAFEQCDISTVIIPNSVTTIGKAAFRECFLLSTLTIPASVASFGEGAIAYCMSMKNVTCEAVTPPLCGRFTGEFNQYIPLYVPTGSVNAYKTTDYWNQFVHILPIKAATVDDVVAAQAEPTDNSVVIEWPLVSEAVVYAIEIKKQSELICTLSFNEYGQLLNIVYPMRSRNGIHNNSQPRMATQTTTGWSYTVTGLDPNTTYTYSIVAKKSNDAVAYQDNVVFTTKNATTAIDETSQQPTGNNQKLLIDGHFYILRDGKMYDMTGKEVK